MYNAEIRILGKPATVVEDILCERTRVKSKSVREIYYECYSLARMLSNVTQETVYFCIYEVYSPISHNYISPRIFVHP